MLDEPPLIVRMRGLAGFMDDYFSSSSFPPSIGSSLPQDSCVFLFRMASGLLQLADGSHTTLELISATIADGMTAVTIILAMSFGLIVPKMGIDRLSDRTTQSKS